MEKFEDRLTRYMDAGLPLLYVDTFEEEKAVEIIRKVFRERGVAEWNIRGFFDHQSNAAMLEQSLAYTLELLLSDENNLARKVLVLKSPHFFLEEPAVVERLKQIAQKINDGTIEECTVICIAPIVKIPIELESYLTILTMDFLTPKEIRDIISGFVREYGLPPLQEDFQDELATMFKGMSETSIQNVLALAVADDGEINHADLPLIFEQ